jgi:hypothetical protein
MPPSWPRPCARVTERTGLTTEARPRLLVVVALLAAASAAGAANFNAKQYGAKGNGVNGDTKVSLLLLLFSSPPSLRFARAPTTASVSASGHGVESGVRRRRRGDAGD